MIPDFRADGYLPDGVHVATEPEVLFRFGSSTPRRQILALRLKRWIDLGREVGARRLLVDGSFVTAKPDPHDVDAVLLEPPDFREQLRRRVAAARELDNMALSRRPEELFIAEDATQWDDWIEFFGRTREFDRRRKGIVEVRL